MIKSLLFIIIFFLSSQNSFCNEPVEDFYSLLSFLKNGKNIKCVISYGKCILQEAETTESFPDITGGMDISAWEYFPAGSIRNEKACIVFSESILIHHYSRGAVINYVKVKVFENNTVEINARYFTPDDFETVMNENFSGELSNSNIKKGVSH